MFRNKMLHETEMTIVANVDSNYILKADTVDSVALKLIVHLHIRVMPSLESIMLLPIQN